MRCRERERERERGREGEGEGETKPITKNGEETLKLEGVNPD